MINSTHPIALTTVVWGAGQVENLLSVNSRHENLLPVRLNTTQVLLSVNSLIEEYMKGLHC